MSYNIHIIERLETQLTQLKETVSLQALEITELTQQYQDEVKAFIVMMGERDKLQQEKDTDSWYLGWKEAVRRMQEAERELDLERQQRCRIDATLPCAEDPCRCSETEKQMPNCELCGEPMPQGEEMFKYHGYSGPCPKEWPPRPPIEDKDAEIARLTGLLTDAGERAHYSHGVAELAMKHRDGAETRLAAATALLRECESILLDVLKVEGISGTMNYDALVAFIARLRAMLEGEK